MIHALAVQRAHRTETRFSATLALIWSLSRISTKKPPTARRTAPARLAVCLAGARRANPLSRSCPRLAGVSRAIWTTLMAVSSDGLRVAQTISILASSDGPRAGRARQTRMQRCHHSAGRAQPRQSDPIGSMASQRYATAGPTRAFDQIRSQAAAHAAARVPQTGHPRQDHRPGHAAEESANAIATARCWASCFLPRLPVSALASLAWAAPEALIRS